MELCSNERDDPSRGYFHDLHSFKDFVVLVLSCAPDMFPHEDWRSSDDQMNLERAFIALRFGLGLIENQLGNTEAVRRCHERVGQSLDAYRSGEAATGQRLLEEVEVILRVVPSN